VVKPSFDESELREFEVQYRTDYEENALHARGAFLDAFPKEHLNNLTVEDYVIGLQKPTFCTFVEVKTRFWARIQGATASKFGIYFGKTKSDPQRKYRFAKKFGSSKISAFRTVKEELLSLISEASTKTPDFATIDQNILSPMFKAKILSLYFPEKFINVCSNDHLELLAAEFGLPEGLYFSEYQNKLVSFKADNQTTRSWSYPKYMAFLYRKYIKKYKLQKSNSGRIPKNVDFRALQERRDARGKAAEEYALEWEKKRLRGADLGRLVTKIQDRTDRPGYGYDFLSYNSDISERYIEVKSVLKLNGSGLHRFYISQNEKRVSDSVTHQPAYYFYLVFFDADGVAVDLFPARAADLYQKVQMDVDSFIVLFQDERQ